MFPFDPLENMFPGGSKNKIRKKNVNRLSENPTKWRNILKKFVGKS